MKKKILSAKSDLIFKLIFGDTRNIDILKGFLKSVLNLPEDDYEKITLLDPNFRIDSQDGKLGILDIKLNTKSKKVINIEIQVLNVPELKERILFYASKMITEQIAKGESYFQIKKTVCIVITDFELIKENNEYFNNYSLFDKNTKSLFTDLLEINTLELPKLPQKNDNTKLWNWLKFINAESEDELDMLAETDPQINKAVAVLKELSDDERTRMIEEAREKARRDEESRLRGAREEGLKEGLKEGQKEGQYEKALEIAKKLLKIKLSISEIETVTGLSKDIIQKLDLENQDIK